MVETRRGLEIIADAASTLYDFKSMQRLAEGVLTQIASLLNVDCAGILVLRDGGRAEGGLLGAGRLRLLQQVYRRVQPRSAFEDDLRATGRSGRSCGGSMTSRRGARCYTSAPAAAARPWCCWRPKTTVDTDRALVEIFGSRLSIAFDNVILYEQLQEANHAAGRARRATHPRPDIGEPPTFSTVVAAAAGQRIQERNITAMSRTT